MAWWFSFAMSSVVDITLVKRRKSFWRDAMKGKKRWMKKCVRWVMSTLWKFDFQFTIHNRSKLLQRKYLTHIRNSLENFANIKWTYESHWHRKNEIKYENENLFVNRTRRGKWEMETAQARWDEKCDWPEKKGSRKVKLDNVERMGGGRGGRK